jgi:hypothetical protein
VRPSRGYIIRAGGAHRVRTESASALEHLSACIAAHAAPAGGQPAAAAQQAGQPSGKPLSNVLRSPAVPVEYYLDKVGTWGSWVGDGGATTHNKPRRSTAARCHLLDVAVCASAWPHAYCRLLHKQQLMLLILSDVA